MTRSSIAPWVNKNGNERSMEERVMAAQTGLSLMKHAVREANETDDAAVLSTTMIDEEVAKIHRMKLDHVRASRKSLCEEDSLVVRFSEGGRGGAADKYSHKNQTVLDEDQAAFVFNYIEEQHALGATVTIAKLSHEIYVAFDIKICRSTLQQYLHQMGLTWRPTKAKKKTFKAYRADAVGTFLIEYAKAKAV